MPRPRSERFDNVQLNLRVRPEWAEYLRDRARFAGHSLGEEIEALLAAAKKDDDAENAKAAELLGVTVEQLQAMEALLRKRRDGLTDQDAKVVAPFAKGGRGRRK